LSLDFDLYYVPRSPKWSYADIVKEMNLTILSDSIAKSIRERRGRLTTKEIGDLDELFALSQLDSLVVV